MYKVLPIYVYIYIYIYHRHVLGQIHPRQQEEFDEAIYQTGTMIETLITEERKFHDMKIKI